MLKVFVLLILFINVPSAFSAAIPPQLVLDQEYTVLGIGRTVEEAKNDALTKIPPEYEINEKTSMNINCTLSERFPVEELDYNCDWRVGGNYTRVKLSLVRVVK